jgi:lactate permease
MYALLAFLPILFCVVAMAVFNTPAKYAMPVSWLMAAILGFFFWKMELLTIVCYSLYGLISSLDVLIIIFGAILVMNTLKMSGGMATINNGFRSVSPVAEASYCDW